MIYSLSNIIESAENDVRKITKTNCKIGLISSGNYEVSKQRNA